MAINNEKILGFVERFYSEVLERDSDENGLLNWSTQLEMGQMSASDIAHGFIFSEEYMNKDTSNLEYINTLYNTILDRNADISGLENWVNQLNNGMDRADILNGFIESVEFEILSNSYGIVVSNTKVSLSNNLVDNTTNLISMDSSLNDSNLVYNDDYYNVSIANLDLSNYTELSQIDAQLANIQNSMLAGQSIDINTLNKYSNQIDFLEDKYEYILGIDIEDYFEAKYSFLDDDKYEYNSFYDSKSDDDRYEHNDFY